MQLELVEIIERVGVTCVMVTHDQEEAMTMAERIAIMHLGWIAQIGSPIDIYETPASRLVCEFIGNVNLFDGEVIEDMEGHALISSPELERKIYVGHGVTTSVEDKRSYLRAASRKAAGDHRAAVVRTQLVPGQGS